MDGKELVRLAQLRGDIAVLARGGRFELAQKLLAQLTRADLALGLPADGLLRARQSAQLAAERGEPVAGPLVVLAATLLAAGALDEALDAATAAIHQARSAETRRIEVMALLVGGAAQRRAGRLTDARTLLDGARGGAARLGESALAGLALAEIGQIDLEEDHPAAAATCFEFSAEFLRRAAQPAAAVEAATLAIASWARAGDIDVATGRAADISDEARRHGRLDLVAYLDGVLAELALSRAPEAAIEACALAAESAAAYAAMTRGGAPPLARELAAQARLRQVRATTDPMERARHLEAGIDLALSLERSRASARLGAALEALVEDASRLGKLPARDELARLAEAIVRVGDPELVALARAALEVPGG